MDRYNAMEQLRNLFSLCFSFRGTLSPKEYAIGCAVIFIIGPFLLFGASTIASLLTIAITPYADFLGFIFMLPVALIFFLLPIAQLSLATRRLRDAGRSLFYLLIPPITFGVLVLVSVLITQWIFENPIPEGIRNPIVPVIRLNIIMLSFLAVPFLTEMAFALFVIFKPRAAATQEKIS